MLDNVCILLHRAANIAQLKRVEIADRHLVALRDRFILHTETIADASTSNSAAEPVADCINSTELPAVAATNNSSGASEPAGLLANQAADSPLVELINDSAGAANSWVCKVFSSAIT